MTIVFNASVDAQGGAYATGVLVLMSSAALAVAITAWRQSHRWVVFVGITIVFAYTTVTNVFERPEGIKIASLFIAVDRGEAIRIIANRPGDGSLREYEDKLEEARQMHPAIARVRSRMCTSAGPKEIRSRIS